MPLWISEEKLFMAVLTFTFFVFNYSSVFLVALSSFLSIFAVGT